MGIARVAAHGPAPAAQSIVAQDAQGPTLVRLTGGLALRQAADRYRFVCPAAWGDDLMLPAARIPGGPAVVAGGRGLFLIDADGRATAHPDPSAAGLSTDFARVGDQLFALRTAAGTTEVLAVDASSVRPVFSEPARWSTIAATAELLGLQRLEDQRLEQLQLAPDGSVVERTSAALSDDTIFVLARATPRALYAVLTTAAGRELGQIESGAYRRLEGAIASIAGPIEVESGAPFIAIDTALVQLSEPRVALQDQLPVQCLGRLGDVAYACTRSGLSSLTAGGLGEPIFELSRMQPPDLSVVEPSQRDACEVQWEHFRYDLVALGIPLREAPDITDAGEPSRPAADGGRSPARAGGCSIATPRPCPSWLALLAGVSLAITRRRSADRRNRALEQTA